MLNHGDIYFRDYISVACPEVAKHWYTGLGTQLKKQKTGAKQHQLFNHIFNINVSTPPQTFNLISTSLKIIELKTLC